MHQHERTRNLFHKAHYYLISNLECKNDTNRSKCLQHRSSTCMTNDQVRSLNIWLKRRLILINLNNKFSSNFTFRIVFTFSDKGEAIRGWRKQLSDKYYPRWITRELYPLSTNACCTATELRASINASKRVVPTVTNTLRTSDILCNLLLQWL